MLKNLLLLGICVLCIAQDDPEDDLNYYKPVHIPAPDLNRRQPSRSRIPRPRTQSSNTNFPAQDTSNQPLSDFYEKDGIPTRFSTFNGAPAVNPGAWGFNRYSSRSQDQLGDTPPLSPRDYVDNLVNRAVEKIRFATLDGSSIGGVNESPTSPLTTNNSAAGIINWLSGSVMVFILAIGSYLRKRFLTTNKISQTSATPLALE